MYVSMNTNLAAKANNNVGNAAVSRNDDHEHMAKFGQQMAQIAKVNTMKAQMDTVQFGHRQADTLTQAATTGTAAVGSVAAAAGSVLAFTKAAAGEALIGLGSIGTPALGIGLAAASALLGLFTVSSFLGGNSK